MKAWQVLTEYGWCQDIHVNDDGQYCVIAGIILGHNHPSGDSTPSSDDRSLTKEMREAGELMHIPLLDHIIVGDDQYYSFRGMGCLN